MSKITLTDLVNLQNENTAVNAINNNNAVLEAALDKTLSRDGTSPNQMSAALDMNSNQIFNLPAPSTISSPARLIDVVSNPTIVVPGTGTSGHTVPFLDGNNTWSGTNTFNANVTTGVASTSTFNGPAVFSGTVTLPANFPTLSSTNTWTGNQFFKTGAPWADVKAYGAVGNGSADDTAAVQAAVDFMSSTYAGGVVFLPPGIYKITSTITMKTSVRIVGSGRNVSYLSGFVTNVNTVLFGNTCTRGCSLEDLTVLGYFNANPALVTTNAIEIAENIPADILNCIVWYGSAALHTQGIDGHYFNTWFNGCTDCVVSNGANWYNRCILDGNGSFGSYRYSFWQGTGFVGAISQENSFVMCDFSGNFTKSIFIQDSFVGTFSVNKFNCCVISSPVDIQNAYYTPFSECEFGSTSFTVNGSTGGSVAVFGCVGFGVTVATPAAVLKACNFNIT